MRSKMLPVVTLAAVVTVFILASSCGGGSGAVQCPVCGTDKGSSVALLSVMPVPEHNPSGEPGGPFNIFDIGWVDPLNHLYYIADRTGLDVPVFSTTSLVAVAAIGGLNSVAEAGNNASTCFDTAKFPNDPAGSTIPPITTAQGNYTRFGCRTMNFSLAGGFGPNGFFGGFMGGQCCASRSNNLNPLSGPNGIEVTPDGSIAFVGTGSANIVAFDMTQTLLDIKAGVALPTPPRVTATIETGTSPDYDGIPNGITGCMQSANGRAFSDPTCGDLRADEISTGIATDPGGASHFLILAANGDPGQPFITIVDATNIVNRTGTQQQQHCLPVNPNAPFSPGGPFAAFPQNLPTCVLGQIYYDASGISDSTVAVDTAAGPCPFPSLTFDQAGTMPVPSGVSGTGVGLAGADVPCHHGPLLRQSAPGTSTNGQFCAAPASFPDCAGSFSPAGIGGSVYNPHTNTFWVTNANSTTDVAVGNIDEVDPFHTVEGFNGFVPVVINSFPVIGCMPSGVVIGPGTDVLITCENHDGRRFPPSTIIMDGSNSASKGTILATIPYVGGADEGWFNTGDGHYYLAARDMPTGSVLGVIDARTRLWLQNITTNSNSHSVAADNTNHRVFVPLAAGALCGTQSGNGCVGVYGVQ
ncbi:MAG: hypothetical protein ACRD5M_04930 [Candidatus Acidiferrales bacterium]